MNDHYSLDELKRILHLPKDDRDVAPWVETEGEKPTDLQSARERYEAIEQAEAQQPSRMDR